MNILILNWRDIKHPLAGGAEISLLEHAKYWRQEGAKVTWISSSFKGAKQEEEIDGIRYIRYGSHFTVHVLTFLNYIKRRIQKPDIVIDSFHFLPYFSPLYIKNTKIISLINESAKNAWFKNVPFPIALIGYLIEPLFFLSYKDKIFIIGSESIKKELEKFPFSLKHGVVIPHGIMFPKQSNLQKKTQEPTIIFLAQLSPDKGVEDALAAFSLLKQQNHLMKFWLVGRSRDQKYLQLIKQRIKELDLEKDVIIYGYVSEDEKFSLLSKAWILVHPSLREGWGLNVIEANIVGTPAVGYNVVGLRDSIKNGETGILVRTDPNALADGVSRLIKDKQLYNKLSNNAKKWAKQFSWEKSSKKSWSVIKHTYEK